MASDSIDVKAAQTEAASNDMSQPLHNDRPKPHKCTMCDKRFSSKRSLSVHIRKHTEQKSYSCPQCEKCYKSYVCLRQHMIIHSGKHKCSECGKCFKCSADLTVHRRTHSGEKPFE